LPQLARANENQWRQLKGAAYNYRSRIPVNLAQQDCNVRRLGDGCKMTAFDRRKCSAQIRRYISIGAASSNGIPEYLTARRKGSMRGFEYASPFDSTNDLEYLRRRNAIDGLLAQPGKYVVLEAPNDF
jgi:hypothetical protein